MKLTILLIVVTSVCALVNGACVIEWDGLSSTYDHTGYYDGKKPDVCCAEAKKKAREDAQNTWNIQKQSFAEELQKKSKASVSISPKCITGCSGSIASDSVDQSETIVEYDDVRFSISASCECVPESFVWNEGGCAPVSLFPGGRKLQQNCPGSGRRQDRCYYDVQCRFKAVSSSDCPSDTPVDTKDFPGPTSSCTPEMARGCAVLGHCTTLDPSLYDDCLTCGFSNPLVFPMKDCSKCWNEASDSLNAGEGSNFVTIHDEYRRSVMEVSCSEESLGRTVPDNPQYFVEASGPCSCQGPCEYTPPTWWIPGSGTAPECRVGDETPKGCKVGRDCFRGVVIYGEKYLCCK